MSTATRGEETAAGAPAEGDGPAGRRWPWTVLRWSVVAAPLLAIAAYRPQIIKATFSDVGTFLRVLAVTVGWIAFSMVVKRFVKNRVARTIALVVPAAVLAYLLIVPYLVPPKRVEEPLAYTRPAATAPAPKATPAGPVLRYEGTFKGLGGHSGSGRALLIENPDGSYVVRVEDFKVDNGPGLGVHVVQGAGKDEPTDGSKIAGLKGNEGNQNYDVPADTDPSVPVTVLVWCAPFDVPVAGATLR